MNVRRTIRFVRTSLGRDAWRRRFRPRLEVLEDRTLPSTFMVANTADSGPGSLRWAIQNVNADPNPSNPDVITFAIASRGVQTIQLLSPLPQITVPVVIDGRTQPTYAGTPVIQLDGSLLTGNSNIGLDITAGGSTVAGIDFTHFSGAGILLEQQGGNLVESCYLGTDSTGTQAQGNGTGVEIQSSGNTVGGTATGVGNIISGNTHDGIDLATAAAVANVIQGNMIGTDGSGTQALGNGGSGIGIESGSQDTQIGGTALGAGNVIAFNAKDGVTVDAGSGHSINRNSIFLNGSGVGIRLASGANNGIQAPHLIAATYDAATQTLTVVGTLVDAPSTTYTLEFFNNSAGDAEGKTFLQPATVTTTAAGAAVFDFQFHVTLAPGYLITATATDPAGDTSEFSNSVGELVPQVPMVANANESGPGAPTAATPAANANAGHAGVPDRIAFGVPGRTVHTITLRTALPRVLDPDLIDATR